MFVRYLVLGVVFGFLGMIIESLTLSIQKKRLVYQGDKYFINFPVKPIYALGGLILFWVVELSKGYPWYATISLSVLAVTLWEYFGGWFCVTILGERLWDYRDKKYQIDGYVSLWSVGWWVVISAVFYFTLFGWFDRLNSYLLSSIRISTSLDGSMFIVFVIFILTITIIRKGHRKNLLEDN